MKESDIARIVQSYLHLQGWDVYPEASMTYGRGRADLAARKDDVLSVVEVKVSLSMQLLEQCDRWVRTKAVNQVFLAVPDRKFSRFVLDVCRWRGLGLLAIHKPSSRVRVVIQPTDLAVTPRRLTAMIDSLHPDMKRYQPGTKTGYSTPYNRTIARVVDFVVENPGALVTHIVDSVDHHYASRKSAAQSLVKAIKKFEQGRLRVKKCNHRYRVYPVVQPG